MTRRRRVWIYTSAATAVAIAIGLIALPEVVRRVAISKIRAGTGRDVAIENVDLNLFTSRLAVKGFRLADRERTDPFVQFDQLNARIRLLPLLTGHVRLAELSLSAPTVRVVRTGPTQFNFSDLLSPSSTQEAPKGAGTNITVDRFALSGGAIIVEDLALNPLRTWTVEGMAVELADFSTRPLGPGGTASVAFTLAGTPISLKVSDLRLMPENAHGALSIQGFDLTLLLPYLPAGAPATLQSGRMTVSLTLGYGADAGTKVGGDLRFENLVVLRQGQTTPLVSAPLVTVAVKDFALRNRDVTVEQIQLEGNPTVFDTRLSPPPRFTLKVLKVAVEGATWPERGPARVQVTAGLPGGGAFNARGTLRMAPLGADLRIMLRGADLAPYQKYFPIAAPLSGNADADVNLVASMEGGLRATVRGKAGVGRVALGERYAPAVKVERAEVSGLDIRWPSRFAVGRVLIRKPSVIVERDQNGKLLLREMFVRTSAGQAGAAASADKPAQTTTTTPATAKPSLPKTAIEIGETVIEDGYAQFIDSTDAPPFIEELSRLAVNIKGLTNAPGKSGLLVLQGVIGATGTIDLHGEVAPLGETLFLDLEGELRDFAIPRTNPYSNRILAWIAREGQLSTKIHFRLEGDKLDAKSEIAVSRLDVVQAGQNDEVKQRIGLPLGLIVALMKDLRGEIRVTVPVSGSLSAPEFSLSEAIWTAVRDVIVNVLTAPFRLIGRLFTKDNKIEGILIDPVRFEPGSGIITPAMDRQLRSVADFLRNSPFVRLALSPVVSATDITSLKTQEVTARIQRLQREQKLADLATAAGRLFSQRFPDQAMPKSVEDIVAALREVEPTPDEMGRALANRRLEAIREALIKTAGIEANRLQPSEAAAPLGAGGEGRMEFSIVP
jgi:hypothetical protein